MATTINLLSDEAGLYAGFSASAGYSAFQTPLLWTADNSTIELIPTEFLTTKRNVVRVAPNISGPIKVYLLNQELSTAVCGRILSFNAKVKPGNQSNISAKLIIDGVAEEDGIPHLLSGGVYGAIQSNRVEVPDDATIHYASIEITVSGHEAQNIFITYPNLIDDEAFYQNNFVPLARNFMPDFYWEIDSLELHPTAPFHRLIDIYSTATNDVYEEYKAIYPFESGELNVPDDASKIYSKSVLVNPTVVRPKYANWLAQFTGAPAKRNLSSSAGFNYMDNLSSELEFLRWQLDSSAYGFSAGDRGSLLEAVEKVLTRTKDGEPTTFSVSLTTSYNDDPWSILIRTIENETLDASDGESSNFVLAAVEGARPLGYKISHLTVPAFYLTLNDTSLGRLNEQSLSPVSSLPGAPNDVSVDSVASTSVTLTFTPLYGLNLDGGGVISNYEYSLSTDNVTYSSYLPLSPVRGHPPITITGLSSATSYWVKLKAVNELGTGTDESVAVSFTTS